jgi:hypothetical protein
MCLDMDDNIITGETQILDRWVEHFNQLLSRSVNTYEQSVREDYNENFKSTQNETKKATGKLKNNKANKALVLTAFKLSS